MKRKLFGTDGIRGIANRYPLTPEMVQRIGLALGAYLKAKYEGRLTVVVGGDTRISTGMIKSSLVSGLTASGVDVVDVGVAPTPAISYLILKNGFTCGVVVSASHNPFNDNGIKFFNHKGEKFSEVEEGSLELVIFNKYELPRETGEKIGRIYDGRGILENYKKFVEGAGRYLAGLKIGIDCANGALSKIAPEVFNSLGAKVFTFFAEPDGVNINRNCGALYPEVIAEKVKELSLDLGFSFDGDGDRCIAVDEKGNVVDGDKILAIFSENFELKNKKVVATVMSNLGLEEFLKKRGIELVRTSVGDRFVSEKMEEVGAEVGGEKSGHVIVRKFLPTGDGLLTAILLASLVKEFNKPLSEFAKDYREYPQKLVNVKVKEKPPLSSLKELEKAKEVAQSLLGEEGRIVVRYSGTEPLLRLMVEAKTEELCEKAIGILKEGVLKEGIADAEN